MPFQGTIFFAGLAEVDSRGSVEAAGSGVILEYSRQVVFGPVGMYELMVLSKKASRGNWSEIVSCGVLQT